MSIRNARLRLPSDFIDQLYEKFSPHLADRIIAGYLKPRKVTLRVNTLKSSVRDVMNGLKERDIKFDRVAWYDDALIMKDKGERDLEALDLYREGHIYLQSLSSMIPPLLLKPKDGERILDMAAAPGSKTTQIAAMMGNKGYILANELDRIRIERLIFNLNRQGVRIAEPICSDGSKLGEIYREEFDRVLLDAPCSGEGLFMVDKPSTYRGWSVKQVKRLSSLQRRLLRSGLAALKPGGLLVYSTCTVNPNENEAVVNEILREYDGKVEIDAPGIKIPGSIDAVPNLGQDCHPGLGKSLRIIPSELMEGFFVALFRKR